jgi:hypothetical protein
LLHWCWQRCVDWQKEPLSRILGIYCSLLDFLDLSSMGFLACCLVLWDQKDGRVFYSVLILSVTVQYLVESYTVWYLAPLCRLGW